MTMTTTTRLEELKASRQPAPLSLFLAIYNKAQRECYIDYMEGAEALHNWLTSDGTIPLDLGITPPILRVPPLLLGYELSRLAGIVARVQHGVAFNVVMQAIYNEVTK